MVYVVNGVLASGLDMVFKKDLYSIDHQLQSIQEDLNQQRINDECIKSHNAMIESRNELLKTMQSFCEMINKKKELQHLEQVANLSTYPLQRFNSFCYDDNDYEESTIPLNEIVSQIPPSIANTPILPTLEPEDSLIMRNEELSTIPEKESDEFIKSSVEDFVPIPSKSKDTSESDSDSDLSSCDDFSPINVYEEKFVTFSNPLFNSNDDFTSSNDKSLSDGDVPEDN
ncbi:hypothetical protein Tco_1572942, partial [Tanacetum coccineum]